MRKIQDVIGLPILDVSSGKKVGIVKDIFFNKTGELKGLVVEKGGFFNKNYYLPFEDIGSMGDDAVTIGTERVLTDFHQNKRYYSFNTGKNSYKELPVMTTNGHELGHIKDVYFMEEVGKIIGYEISDGFLTDITEGRRTIQIPKKMTIGEDALVIPQNEVQDIIFEKDQF